MSKQELNEETNASRTRYQQRSKRKKTNLILNGLIVVVILLIGFVSYSIFSNKEQDTADTKDINNKEQKTESTSQKESKDSNKASDDELEEDQEVNEDGAIVTEGGSDSNVISTIENPSWKPVGTTQTGEHVATYTEGTDWNEQLEALAYATGLDSDNMVIWFLGNNNKDQQKSIGTVSSKDKTEKYRVYIEWVDGSGWKPTKVEEIQDLNIR